MQGQTRERIERLADTLHASGLGGLHEAEGLVQALFRPSLWEDRFPGNGDALLDILEPFYHWQPKREPALPDLLSRARNAIFWRGLKGVDLLNNSNAWSQGCKNSYGSLSGSMSPPVLRSLFRSQEFLRLENELADALDGSLLMVLRRQLRNSLGRNLVNTRGLEAVLTLEFLLLIPCGYILIGRPEEAARFKPLQELLLAGNFPAGLGHDGVLGILVAD